MFFSSFYFFFQVEHDHQEVRAGPPGLGGRQPRHHGGEPCFLLFGDDSDVKQSLQTANNRSNNLASEINDWRNFIMHCNGGLLSGPITQTCCIYYVAYFICSVCCVLFSFYCRKLSQGHNPELSLAVKGHKGQRTPCLMLMFVGGGRLLVAKISR